MNARSRFLLAAVAFAGIAVVPAMASASSNGNSGSKSEIIGKHTLDNFNNVKARNARDAKPAPTRTASGNGISYHSGPVLLGTTNVYVIWYGNWPDTTSSASTPVILTDLLSTVGGTPHFNINSTYYSVSGTTKSFVSNSVKFVSSTTDNYSRGTALSDANIQTIVSDAITSNRLPKDTNGVYFVLTSSDVNETSGFLTQYCGWHTRGTIGGANIKFSFVGDPARNYGACAAQTTSPNGNASADAMASVITHELEETVTDPNLNAWYDSRGYENADKCAWTFGTTTTLSSGAKYNVTFGARNFLIQRNWLNANGGSCTMGY